MPPYQGHEMGAARSGPGRPSAAPRGTSRPSSQPRLRAGFLLSAEVPAVPDAPEPLAALMSSAALASSAVHAALVPLAAPAAPAALALSAALAVPATRSSSCLLTRRCGTHHPSSRPPSPIATASAPVARPARFAGGVTLAHRAGSAPAAGRRRRSILARHYWRHYDPSGSRHAGCI